MELVLSIALVATSVLGMTGACLYAFLRWLSHDNSRTWIDYDGLANRSKANTKALQELHDKLKKLSDKVQAMQMSGPRRVSGR